MWYNEKFVYHSNSPGFYAISFLGKKLFWCYMMYNWDVKIPGKEKKTIIVRKTNLVGCLLDCLFCLSKLLLLLLPWWLSPPLFRRPRAARRASPGTLRIAIPYYFTARYFTHDQCGEWKYNDSRGEISYFTHELYAQNCLKIFSIFLTNTSVCNPLIWLIFVVFLLYLEYWNSHRIKLLAGSVHVMHL